MTISRRISAVVAALVMSVSTTGISAFADTSSSIVVKASTDSSKTEISDYVMKKFGFKADEKHWYLIWEDLCGALYDENGELDEEAEFMSYDEIVKFCKGMTYRGLNNAHLAVAEDSAEEKIITQYIKSYGSEPAYFESASKKHTFTEGQNFVVEFEPIVEQEAHVTEDNSITVTDLTMISVISVK